MAAIKFVPSADASVVSAHSRRVLNAILDAAALPSCIITSTVRTPERQARAMLVNIEATSVQRQFDLYGPAGREVIREYQRLQPLGHGRSAVLDAMTERIRTLGPGKVSRHCADPSRLNVIDIAPSSLASVERFTAAVAHATARGDVSKFFGPQQGDPAFHLEIPQP